MYLCLFQENFITLEFLLFYIYFFYKIVFTIVL